MPTRAIGFCAAPAFAIEYFRNVWQPGHTPLVAVPYFLRSYLYDWTGDVASRASVVTDMRVEPELDRQLERLFEDGWDGRTTALIERDVPPAGEPVAPVAAYAKSPTGTSTRVLVEAGAGAEGGYLILLDSYSEDWRVTVDGRPAEMTRANGAVQGSPPGGGAPHR